MPNSKPKLKAKVKIKLSKPQEEIIDVLAHIIIMHGIDKNVPNAQGILDSYLNQLPARSQAIFEHFQSHCTTVKQTLVKMMEKDSGNA